MRFVTDDNREITWSNGVLAGDQDLVHAIEFAVSIKFPCSFNYWGEQDADITTEFRAYLTIGSVIRGLYGTDPFVDDVPDNPHGYEPEGPVLPSTLERLTAAVERK